MLPYQDPEHEGNSAKYHSGKPCHTKGCKEPAGTHWSPHWCFRHNVERIDNISSTLETMVEKAKLAELVDKAVADWRRTCGNLIAENRALIRAAGGRVTVTKQQLEAPESHSGCQYHKDGSRTYTAT